MRLALALVLVSSIARADVIFEEPTQRTCGSAEIIVAGTVAGTTTAGPFTNARPPTVKVTATECPRGCKAGDKLEVASWVEPKPSHSGKPGAADPRAEEAAWLGQPVAPPKPGTSVLLFLRRDGKQLLRVQDSGGYGGYVMLVGADARQVRRSVGMCQVAVGIAGERDRVATVGKPVLVHVDATNLTDARVPFHAEELTLKLQTDTRPGEDLAPSWTVPALATLAPKATQGYDWDLAKLFPGQFAKPGAYWLTLDAPGQLGLHWIAIAVK